MQASGDGNTDTCDFLLLFPDNGCICKVSLHLHHQVVDSHAAIHSHLRHLLARVFAHRVDDLACPEAWRLEHGADHVSLGCVGAEANPEAAGVVAPVRREDTLERRHEVDISAVRDRGSKRFKALSVIDETDGLAPMDSSTCYLDCALEGILRLSVHVVAKSCQEAMIGLDDLGAGVLEEEAPSAVRVLHLSLPEHMAKTGCVLIAEVASDWYTLKHWKSGVANLSIVVTGLLL